MAKKISVEITVPVYNEEEELEKNITSLNTYLAKECKAYDYIITIADNASTDTTPVIGKRLAQQDNNIHYKRFEEKGRGRAVKAVWGSSKADICAYMDIDLSTDLHHFVPVISALTKGYDISIGSRLLSHSRVIERSLKREFISRVYNVLIKALFQTKFSDAQCGFKAIRKDVANELIPYVEDNEWFMDTELLIIAEKTGHRIYEEPVVWHDNPGSTVRVLPTALGDLRGLMRLWLKRPWRHIPLHDINRRN